ncbi:MAG: sulfotransferase domain-containing protein [Anaerolineae bacterium]|nr:sulfotransferase domain-containing protein [Anaerolineae bacterium]
MAKSPSTAQLRINRILRNYLNTHGTMDGVIGELEAHLQQSAENKQRLLTSLESDPALREAVITAVSETPALQQELITQFAGNPGGMGLLLQELQTNEDFQHRVLEMLTDLEILQGAYHSLVREHPEQLRRLLVMLEKEPALMAAVLSFLKRKGFTAVKLEAVKQWLSADEEHLADLLRYLQKNEAFQEGLREFMMRKPSFAPWIVEWITAEESNLKKFLQAVRNDPDQHRALFNALGSSPEFREAFRRELWQEGSSIQEFFATMAEDESLRTAFVREASQREPYRSILQVMRSQETVNHLSYILPTVTLSFPRSGSNFFQTVLQGSSGLTCISLYHPNYPSNGVFNLKSHALTPDNLRREFADMVPYAVEYPEKMILIQRDPRDVMISFYHFACANHQQEFTQDEFLGLNYYFAANQPGKRGVKNVLYLPGPESCTVLEAFQLFTASHFGGNEDSVRCVLAYEAMVQSPQETFQRAFEFLGLDCKLDPVFLNFKVSQYSDENRQRGMAGGWRETQTRQQYALLIDRVNAHLSNEIEALGYSLD